MEAATMSLDLCEILKDSMDIIEDLVGQVAKSENRSEFRELLGRLDWDATTDESHANSPQDCIEQQADALSISDTVNTKERNMVKRRWMVIDELVYNSPTTAIQKQMKKFAEERLRWTLITCPTVNDRIMIHLAMGIGANLVVGIRLYDLTPVNADQNRLAVEGLLDTAHCQVSSSTMIAPDEYYAIKEDDPKLLEWLLAPVQGGSSGQHTYSKLYGTEGMNLLHLAAQANSSSVVKWLREKLTYDQWLKLERQKDRNGNSPTHLAILVKGSAVVHQLLKPLRIHDLETVLHIPTENPTCQTALQLVNSDPQYRDLKGLIVYHRELRVHDQLMDYFDNFEFSLYSYELKATREKIAHRRIEDRAPEDPATKRNINFDAAICLMQGNITKAKALIDTAMEIVPKDINTWCNKGKYLLMLEDAKDVHLEEAMEAAFKMLELLTDKSIDSRLRAKIDYAYFIAEANRGDEDRRHSKVIFDECLAAVGQCANSNLMSAHCCYLFIKTLVRGLKSHLGHRLSKPEERDDIHKAFDLLGALATMQYSPEYDSTMWVWLAELQFLNLSEDLMEDLIKQELEEFSQRTGFTKTSPFSCLEKATEIVLNNKNKVNRKTSANIARNCLKLANSTNDEERKIYLLERAFADSERWIDVNYWTYECANTAADALWQLWNIEMYNQHTDLVKETYAYTSGGRSQLNYKHHGVRFCIREFYHPSLRGHPITKNYLPSAKKHLERLVEEGDCWLNTGIKLARIKYLLESPHEEIVEAYTYTLDNCLPGRAKVIALQHYGFYLGIVGNKAEADFYLRKAMTETEAGFTPFLARNGLKLLEHGKPFYPPPRD